MNLAEIGVIKGITGTDRFVQRSYELFNRFPGLMNQVTPKDVYELAKLNENEKQIYKKVNQTIKKYDEEINHFRFNTAIAAMMELLNEMKKLELCSIEIQCYTLKRYAVLLAPIAPHLSEECFNILGSNQYFKNRFGLNPMRKPWLEESHEHSCLQVNREKHPAQLKWLWVIQTITYC